MLRMFAILSFATALLLVAPGDRTHDHAAAWSGGQTVSAVVHVPGCGAAADRRCQESESGHACCANASCWCSCPSSIALGSIVASTPTAKRDKAGLNLADRGLRPVPLERDPPIPRPPA
jgi:hypothetical protein